MLNNRCQHILNSKKYQIDDTNLHFYWAIKGSLDRLELKYSDNENKNIVLCREALALLLNNRSTKRVWEINFKEFENFLRDDNLTSAFDPISIKLIEESFGSEKKFLILAIFNHFFRESNDQLVGSYISKIRLGLKVIECLNQLFGDEFALKINQMEHEFVYYQAPKTAFSNEFINLIEKIFCFVFKEDIKLVAV